MGKFLAFILTLLLSLAATAIAMAKETLFINEITASNKTGIMDASGAREDWFEIYNPNNHAIDLAGYYLSDNVNTPTKFQVPAGPDSPKIPANGYIIIWASSAPARGVTHTSFGLSASGEAVLISSPQQELIDQVIFGNQTDDVSYGRKPDGSGTFVFFSTTTPGSSNNGAATVLPKLNPPTLSQAAGFRTSDLLLTISHSEPNVRIRYTTDGSEPQDNTDTKDFKYKNKYNDDGTHPDAGQVGEGWSLEFYATQLYTGPITIHDRTPAPNKVSRKTSSITYDPGYLPSTPIYKGTVVRAKVYKDGFLPSETVTRTYFIHPSGGTKYAVPVVAVNAPETSFFDYDQGIYTPGVTFDQFRTANPNTPIDFCSVGNFTWSGDASERSGSIEFFNNGGLLLNQNFGFRIHGGCSRSVPQKSLRLYSPTEFNFPVFPEQPTRFPKRLLLRNSGNDNNSTLFRDSYFQKLVGNLSFDTQLSRPSVVFINSEYWGIHNITERYDKYYLEKKYGVNRDHVDLVDVEIPEADEGDLVKYNELLAFAQNHSLAVAGHYNTLKTMIDIGNFTDYQIAEIFSANTDWPHKNIRLWRNKVDYNPAPELPYGHDGRWRFMLYDTDITLGLNVKAHVNPIPNAINGLATSIILQKLLENAEYKTYFINRLADLLNTTFLPSRSVPLLAATKAMYEPLIEEHITRWKSPASVPFWNQSIGEIQTFLNERGAYLRGHARQSFNSNLTDVSILVDVNDAAQGYVKVNTIDILPTTDGIAPSPYPWAGTYFQNNPMKLTAIARPGNHFVRWEKSGINVSQNPELSLTATTSTLAYKAVFAAGALPVVLKSFEAKRDGSKVIVTWETTAEVNNDYFVIERSSDARNWLAMATVKGSATTADLHLYRTADEQPLSGIGYYRLKQVDFDQSTTFSRIVSVDMGNFILTGLWPNPATDHLHIVPDPSLEHSAYEITDMHGRSVSGFQKLPAAGTSKIPLNNLPAGTYIMTIRGRDGVKRSGKFVKQ